MKKWLQTSTSPTMQSSKNPKISQHTCTQIWKQYSIKILSQKKLTQTSLAIQYGISRQTISKIIHHARDVDFNIHKPINKQFQTFQYFSLRMEKQRQIILKKDERKAKRENIARFRYEHKLPGIWVILILNYFPQFKVRRK